MIGLGSLGSSRWDLAHYLAKAPKDGQTRAAFSFGINLVTDDPYEAAALMQKLSDAERQSVRPVYHLSVSFSPVDSSKLSPKSMREIAVSIMEKLEIAHHYALIVGHEDKKHPHFHLMVDRRDPISGNLWRHPSWRRLHYGLRLVEREYGLTENPSNLAKLPDQEWPNRPDRLTLGARRALYREMQAAGVDKPEQVEFSKLPLELRARTEADFYFKAAFLDQCRSWSDLTSDLKTGGYFLVPNPRGLVLTDGSTDKSGKVICVALSRVVRTVSRPKLERRFGAFDDFLTERAKNGRAYTVPGLGEFHAGLDSPRPVVVVERDPGGVEHTGEDVFTGAAKLGIIEETESNSTGYRGKVASEAPSGRVEQPISYPDFSGSRDAVPHGFGRNEADRLDAGSGFRDERASESHVREDTPISRAGRGTSGMGAQADQRIAGNWSGEGQGLTREGRTVSRGSSEAGRNIPRDRSEEHQSIDRGVQRAADAGGKGDGYDAQLAGEESRRDGKEFHEALGRARESERYSNKTEQRGSSLRPNIGQEHERSSSQALVEDPSRSGTRISDDYRGDLRVGEPSAERVSERSTATSATPRAADVVRLPHGGSGPTGSNAGNPSVAGAQLGRVNEPMSRGLKYILMRIDTYVEQKSARETISSLESSAQKELLTLEDFVRSGKAKIDPATFQKQSQLANENIEVVAITIRRAFNGLNEAERGIVAARTPPKLMKDLRLDRMDRGLGL